MKILSNKYYLLICLIVFAFSSPLKAKISVGDQLLASLGKTSDGVLVNAQDFAGKVVIISFWATWYPPCMKEIPVLSGIQKKAGIDNVQVVAVNYKESWRRFLDVSKALAGNTMLLTFDKRGRIGNKFGVDGIPHMVIVGGDGKVLNVHVGYNEKKLPVLIKEINQAIRESILLKQKNFGEQVL